MGDTLVSRDRDGVLWVSRFPRSRRVEHVFAIVCFFGLVITGFPQRFHDTGWALWLIQLFGGLDSMRYVHRVFGVAFAIHGLLHLGAIVAAALRGRLRPTLLPVPSDLRDAWDNLLYYLGLRARPPRLPKFDYRQKFEYVGLILGGLVMIVSGLVLMYPLITIRWLPGEVIPAAQVAHSNEALLALSVLLVWHIYATVLSPRVFPIDKSMFRGTMPLEELRHHHRGEYDRLLGPDPESLLDALAPGTSVMLPLGRAIRPGPSLDVSIASPGGRAQPAQSQ